MSKPFSFSFSALSTFEQCEKKYYHLYDAKDVKDEDSEASKDGKEQHIALKARVIDANPLPPGMRHLEALAAKFAAAPGQKYGEMKLAVNSKFQPCAWFAPDTYIRAIVDLLIVQGKTAVIVDWKTGKPKDDFTQMGLTAAVLSKCMPEIELFKTLLVWTQGAKPHSKNYSLSKLEEVWADILPRAGKIQHARNTVVYQAKPSGLCRGYCPVKNCPHYQDR